MDIGHFQFLSGLLEICIALNLGFAIAPGFRSLPRRRFDSLYQNWTALQNKESSSLESSDDVTSRLLASAKKTVEEGNLKEGRFVIATLVSGILTTFLLTFVASIPLIGSFASISDVLIYKITFGAAILSLAVVFYAYIYLAISWRNELLTLKKSCEIGKGVELDTLFPA